MAIKQDNELHEEPQRRGDHRESDIVVKPDGEVEERRRKSALLRVFAARLAAESPGITPKWQRAIDNYKRLKAEKISRVP